MRRLFFRVAVVVPLLASPAGAEPRSSDKAAAEALFSEGRSLMTAGRHAEACPKFEASQRLDPGIGTMLNLAECYEKTGRTASAWAEFREVVSAARAAGSKEREDLARQRAEALEPKLCRLSISLSDAAKNLPGLEVRRDGAVVDAAELGSAIPVDPGAHAVEVSAPGKEKWLTKVDVSGEGRTIVVELPPLADAGDGSAPPSTGLASIGSATASSSSSGGISQRSVAIGVGALGILGLGVGTFFGIRASSKWDDAKSECTDYPRGCGTKGADLAEDAKSQATLSTIGFGIGAAGLAVGAVLWFTADTGSGSETAPAVGFGPSQVTVRGRF